MSRSHSFTLEGQGYRCENCNLYNDILTTHCRDCNLHRNNKLELAAIKVRVSRNLDSTKEYIEMSEKNNVDKFQGFFNSGKILYSSMSFEKRREWRDELAEILMTARANLSAADWVDREESDKLTPEQRKWLVSNEENTGSNALSEPKVRKERQTKADKLKEQMMSLGLDMSEVRNIMGQVEKNAKEPDMNRMVFKRGESTSAVISEFCRIERHSDCIGRYTDDKGSHECSCDCHNQSNKTTTDFPVNNSNNNEPTVNNSPELPKAFDASKLKFGV